MNGRALVDQYHLFLMRSSSSAFDLLPFFAATLASPSAHVRPSLAVRPLDARSPVLVPWPQHVTQSPSSLMSPSSRLWRRYEQSKSRSNIVHFPCNLATVTHVLPLEAWQELPRQQAAKLLQTSNLRCEPRAGRLAVRQHQRSRPGFAQYFAPAPHRQSCAHRPDKHTPGDSRQVSTVCAYF